MCLKEKVGKNIIARQLPGVLPFTDVNTKLSAAVITADFLITITPQSACYIKKGGKGEEEKRKVHLAMKN